MTKPSPQLSTRREFEQSAIGRKLVLTRSENGLCYVHYPTQIAWEAWRAAKAKYNQPRH